ncbi:MAG: hypothetical protein DWQ31_15545 [Planctomycetota bacterium]|nr:MAG: hypothetical protein DWQ31_15545 [Planctomycetota bacterium]REJ89980.1 MAG: hypothetical protein DWQ35_17330 [Planctomycetota bacterium]
MASSPSSGGRGGRRRRAQVSATPPLEMRRQGATTHIALSRSPRLSYVELNEDLASGGTGTTGTSLDRDDQPSTDPWIPDSEAIENVTDPQGGTYLAGERHLCLFHERSGSFLPVPGVLWHLGRADEDISPESDGAVVVWMIDGGGDPAASAQTVMAYDWSGSGARRGDPLFVYQHLQSRRWYFLLTGPSMLALVACVAVEGCLSGSASAVALSGTATTIPYDVTSANQGSGLSLSTSGPTAGEITANASGFVEIFHQVTDSTSGSPSGENVSEWFLQHRRAGESFVTLEETRLLVNHPGSGSGRETKFAKLPFHVAYGDSFRLQARQLSGPDALVADSLAGGGPTNKLGIKFCCPPDTTDYTPELTDPAGGTTSPKLGGYYRLDESSGSRQSQAGALIPLLDTGGNSTGSSSGVAGNTAHFSQVDNELSQSYSGVTDLRPASEQFNIAFWIYPEDLSNGDPANFHQIVGLAGITGWQVHLDKTDGIRWRVTGPGFTTTTTAYANLAPGKWYFFMGQVDGPHQKIRMRVRAADWSLDETHLATGPASYDWATSTGNYTLSIRNSIASAFVNFRIDEIGVWSDRILTAGQENFLFSSGRGRRLL